MAATFNRMISKLKENSDKQRQFISDASHEKLYLLDTKKRTLHKKRIQTG